MSEQHANRIEMPTAIDLFAGAGGLTQGLKQAGFRVLGAIEKDVVAQEVYRLNHPDVRFLWGDIRTISPLRVMQELRLEAGELDLLAGCPPCQGFSRVRTLNKTAAVEDDRNDLIFRFLLFVEVLIPKAVMLENVPALAKDERMKRFVDRLAELGYYAGSDCLRLLDAADYGVPQRRKRLLLMTALRRSVPFAQAKGRTVTVRQAIGHLAPPPLSGDPLHDLPERRSDRVLQIIKSIPIDGGSRAHLPENLRLKCHEDIDGFSDVYGRMAWDTVAPTITAGCYHPSKGRFLHPEQNRSISMREAALLQGFPMSYRFPPNIGKVKIASLIGNALPPPFVAQQARMIRAVVGRRRRALPTMSRGRPL